MNILDTQSLILKILRSFITQRKQLAFLVANIQYRLPNIFSIAEYHIQVLTNTNISYILLYE